MEPLLQAALPLVVGALTFLTLQLVKRASHVVEQQAPLVKRGLAVAIALTVTLTAEALGVPSPCSLAGAEQCLGQLTPTAVQGLVGALVAMAMHSLAKPA